jgi:hypothetical protein
LIFRTKRIIYSESRYSKGFAVSFLRQDPFIPMARPEV